MEDNRIVNTNPIRERLSAYTKLLREIDNQLERLERIESTMLSPSAPKLTGMPRCNTVTDRNSLMIERLTELDDMVRETVQQEQAERKELEMLIQCMAEPDERQVIRLKYFDRCEWADIVGTLFIEKPDYNENYEKYKSRAYRLHSFAIRSLARAEIDRAKSSSKINKKQ